jgi:RNA polymerase sigma factor (sigma-70 family)
VSAESLQGVRCPIRPGAIPTTEMPYPDSAAVNEAVAAYRAVDSPAERTRLAQQLYLRHLPLVIRTLSRFCSVSECEPGLCYPEELLGESYLEFRAALDDYDPDRSVDFLGYVALRLHRSLRHEVHAMRTTRGRELGDVPQDLMQRGETESRLIDELFVRELLEHLDPADANLVQLRYAAGVPAIELAKQLGTSDAAMRKRLERLRERLRHHAGDGL